MRRVCKRGLCADCHMSCSVVCLSGLPGRWIEHWVPSKRPNQARHFASLPPLLAKCRGGRFGSTRNPACEKTGLSGRRTPLCVFAS